MASQQQITYPRLVIEPLGHFSRVVIEHSPDHRVPQPPALPHDHMSGNGLLVMYTDASVLRPRYGGHAACSVVWHNGGQWNGRSRILQVARGRDLGRPPKPAVDAAEMAGIISALEIATDLTVGTPESLNGNMLLIWTDSQHCVDRIHWCLRDLWTRPLLGMPVDMDPPVHGARRLPQQVAGEKTAARLIRRLAHSGLVVDVNWLKAHRPRQDRLGNTYADDLAGMTTGRQQNELLRQPIGSWLFWDFQSGPNNPWSVVDVVRAPPLDVAEAPVAVPAFGAFQWS